MVLTTSTGNIPRTEIACRASVVVSLVGMQSIPSVSFLKTKRPKQTYVRPTLTSTSVGQWGK